MQAEAQAGIGLRAGAMRARSILLHTLQQLPHDQDDVAAYLPPFYTRHVQASIPRRQGRTGGPVLRAID